MGTFAEEFRAELEADKKKGKVAAVPAPPISITAPPIVSNPVSTTPNPLNIPKTRFGREFAAELEADKKKAPPAAPGQAPADGYWKENHWFYNADQPGAAGGAWDYFKQVMNPVPLIKGAAKYYSDPPDTILPGDIPGQRDIEDLQMIGGAAEGLWDMAKDVYWDVKNKRFRTAAGKSVGGVIAPILLGKLLSKGRAKIAQRKSSAPVLSPEQAKAQYENVRGRVPSKPISNEIGGETRANSERNLAKMHVYAQELQNATAEAARRVGKDYFDTINDPKFEQPKGDLAIHTDKDGVITKVNESTWNSYEELAPIQTELNEVIQAMEQNAKVPSFITDFVNDLGVAKGDLYTPFDNIKRAVGSLSKDLDSGIYPRDRWNVLGRSIVVKMKDLLKQKLRARAIELGKDPAAVEKSFDDYNTAWYHHRQLWRTAPKGPMKAAKSAYELENIAEDRAGGRFPVATGVETVGAAKIPAQRLWEMTERTASADKALKKSTGDLLEHALSDATNARNMRSVVSPDDLLGNAIDHIYEGREFGRWRKLMQNGVADELTAHRPDIKWTLDAAFETLDDVEKNFGKAATNNFMNRIVLQLKGKLGRGPLRYAEVLKQATQNTESGRRFLQVVKDQYKKLPTKQQIRGAAGTAIRRGTLAGPAMRNIDAIKIVEPPKAASDEGE